MSKSVYVETSIFSFYHDRREAPEIVARRTWTRQWWAEESHRYDLVTSVAVLAELDRGSLPHRGESLAMAAELPALVAEEDAAETVGAYVAHKVMPADPVGDALHLALASINKCDFLLTWNCRHLANANKFGHIRRVNALLGLHVPDLVTPLELMSTE